MVGYAAYSRVKVPELGLQKLLRSKGYTPKIIVTNTLVIAVGRNFTASPSIKVLPLGFASC
jgi:hypothetical protein